MRRICGKCECDCKNLTPSQKLCRLIKLMRCNVTDYSVGLSVIQNYNSLASEKHCQEALERLLTWSLSDTVSERKYNFLDQLWSSQGNFSYLLIKLYPLIFKCLNIRTSVNKYSNAYEQGV